MKKSIVLIVAIFIAIAVLLAVPVMRALAAGPSLEFIAGYFVQGKGYVFLFNVKGPLDEFNGFVFHKGIAYRLHCAVRDDGKVACVWPEWRKAAGERVYLSFGARSGDGSASMSLTTYTVISPIPDSYPSYPPYPSYP